MHYLGLAILKAPTEEALEEVMSGAEGAHWDWYRPGGRWDGWLLGEEEEKRRETDGGFNFADENKRIDRNICPVSEFNPERVADVDFVTGDWRWIQKTLFVEGYPDCRFETNARFIEDAEALLAARPDGFVVVIDAHN